MIKFVALNESRYHSRPRSARGEALWHNKCITFKKSGGKKVCPSWLATVHDDTVTG